MAVFNIDNNKKSFYYSWQITHICYLLKVFEEIKHSTRARLNQESIKSDCKNKWYCYKRFLFQINSVLKFSIHPKQKHDFNLAQLFSIFIIIRNISWDQISTLEREPSNGCWKFSFFQFFSVFLLNICSLSIIFKKISLFQKHDKNLTDPKLYIIYFCLLYLWNSCLPHINVSHIKRWQL